MLWLPLDNPRLVAKLLYDNELFEYMQETVTQAKIVGARGMVKHFHKLKPEPVILQKPQARARASSADRAVALPRLLELPAEEEKKDTDKACFVAVNEYYRYHNEFKCMYPFQAPGWNKALCQLAEVSKQKSRDKSTGTEDRVSTQQPVLR